MGFDIHAELFGISFSWIYFCSDDVVDNYEAQVSWSVTAIIRSKEILKHFSINLSSEIRVFNLTKIFLHKFGLNTEALVETERKHFG